MSEKKTGLLPWPQDPAAFVAQAKKDGKVAMWNTDLRKLVRESSKGKGENHEVVYHDADPSDPVFFGLPHCDPRGMPQNTMSGENKKVTTWHPLEQIEGIPVKHIYADLETGCGVYLRLDAYDPDKTEAKDESDEGGKATKKALGVASGD